MVRNIIKSIVRPKFFPKIEEELYPVYITDFNDQTFGDFTNKSGNDLDWVIGNRTSLNNLFETGPNGDFPTGINYYAYLEKQSNGDPSKTANLVGQFNLKTNYTLQFTYHMWTNDEGGEAISPQLLKVFVKYSETDDYRVVFDTSGNQGNQWNNVSLNIDSGETVFIKFSGTTSSSQKGYIGIDYIRLHQQSNYITNINIETLQDTSKEIIINETYHNYDNFRILDSNNNVVLDSSINVRDIPQDTYIRFYYNWDDNPEIYFDYYL